MLTPQASAHKYCVGHLCADVSGDSSGDCGQGSCSTGCKGVAKGWHDRVYGTESQVRAWGLRHWLRGIITAHLLKCSR